eukprot:3723413-Rhodomonas_salina.2
MHVVMPTVLPESEEQSGRWRRGAAGSSQPSIVLRTCYEMSGTDVGYPILSACYAMSGTDRTASPDRPTHLLGDVQY